MQNFIVILIEMCALACSFVSIMKSMRSKQLERFDKIFFSAVSAVFLIIAIWYANSAV